MWVEKTKTGKHQFREQYTDELTGKKRTVSITFNKHTRKTEQQALIILQEKINEKLTKSANDITFKELSKKWLKEYKTTVKQSTYTQREKNINVINRTLGSTLISKLEHSDINTFLLNLKQKGYAKSTIKSYKATFSLALDFGLWIGFLKDKKMIDNIRMPKFTKEQEEDFKFLEKNELQNVIKQLQELNYHEYARLCLIQAYTGMRFGELVALDYRKHINLEKQTIYIEHTWNYVDKIFTLPKNNLTRTIHFNNQTKKLILEQIQYAQMYTFQKGLNKNTLLFKGEEKYPIHIHTVNNVLKKVKSDKYLTTHIFRHTFIARMIEQGVNQKLIAEQVGHTNTNTIDKYYSHFTDKMNEELANEISKLNYS